MPLKEMSTIPQEIAAYSFPVIEDVVLLGSGVLELHGIREAADIDLVTTPENMEYWLSKRFPLHRARVHALRRISDGSEFTRTSLTDEYERFDIWEHWYDHRRPLGDRQVYVADLKPLSTQHELGFYVLSLPEVRALKQAAARESDLRDVALIDEYLRKTR